MSKNRNLNWLLCNEELRTIYRVAGLAPRNLIYSSMRFIYGLWRSLFFIVRRSAPKHAEIVFFVSSDNIYNAMSPVINKLDQSCVVEMVNPFSRRANAFFPLHKVYLATILSWPTVVKEYKNTESEYIKDVYKARGDLLAIAPSMLEVSIWYLRQLKPKVVVVSNDLVIWDIAIVQAAKHLGIKSVYMQHSSVSKHVPPLIVDFAFLDGQDSGSKYRACADPEADKTEIYLSGGARHDSIFRHKHLAQGSSNIGLCVNMVDSIESVRQTATLLSLNSNLRITIRPHPRESRISDLKLISKEINAKWSDPKANSVAMFLRSQDTIIAGDSSILLEAALSNRKVITYKRLGAFDDYIGLVGNNVILSASSEQDLVEILDQPFHASETGLKKYSALRGSKFEGQSGHLIANAIKQIAKNGRVKGRYWQKNTNEEFYTFSGPTN